MPDMILWILIGFALGAAIHNALTRPGADKNTLGTNPHPSPAAKAAARERMARRNDKLDLPKKWPDKAPEQPAGDKIVRPTW